MRAMPTWRALRRSAICSGLLAAMGAAQAYEPQVNYMLNCMGCHVANGAGAPGKVPAIRDTLVPFAQVPAGRRFLVQVPGTAQSPLSNREVAALLNWMLHNLAAQPPPAALREFTEDEVAAYRQQRVSDLPGTRARLLRKRPR